jgi:hypothetical protein
MEKGGGNILLVLNDRIPDGQDISWIWDVEFENISTIVKNIFVSGDRVYDMAVRMKYAGFTDINAQENVEEAINTVIEKTEKSKNVVILCTYSAMLETRAILVGRKLL